MSDIGKSTISRSFSETSKRQRHTEVRTSSRGAIDDTFKCKDMGNVPVPKPSHKDLLENEIWARIGTLEQ